MRKKDGMKRYQTKTGKQGSGEAHACARVCVFVCACVLRERERDREEEATLEGDSCVSHSGPQRLGPQRKAGLLERREMGGGGCCCLS